MAWKVGQHLFMRESMRLGREGKREYVIAWHIGNNESDKGANWQNQISWNLAIGLNYGGSRFQENLKFWVCLPLVCKQLTLKSKKKEFEIADNDKVLDDFECANFKLTFALSWD